MADDAIALYSAEVDLAKWADIAYAIAGGLQEDALSEDERMLPTHEWIAEKYEITPKEAIGILAHPKFASFLHNMQTSLARADFDIFAYNRLVQIIKWGSDKDAISASKELAHMIGYRKDSALVNVNVNIDKVINDLQEHEVIDAEFQDYPGL